MNLKFNLSEEQTKAELDSKECTHIMLSVDDDSWGTGSLLMLPEHMITEIGCTEEEGHYVKFDLGEFKEEGDGGEGTPIFDYQFLKLHIQDKNYKYQP